MVHKIVGWVQTEERLKKIETNKFPMRTQISFPYKGSIYVDVEKDGTTRVVANDKVRWKGNLLK